MVGYVLVARKICEPEYGAFLVFSGIESFVEGIRIPRNALKRTDFVVRKVEY